MTARQSYALAVIGVAAVVCSPWAPPMLAFAMMTGGAGLAALAAYDHARKLEGRDLADKSTERALQRRYRRRVTPWGPTYQGTPNRSDVVESRRPRFERVRVVPRQMGPWQ
jgi:hypothetical protein